MRHLAAFIILAVSFTSASPVLFIGSIRNEELESTTGKTSYEYSNDRYIKPQPPTDGKIDISIGFAMKIPTVEVKEYKIESEPIFDQSIKKQSVQTNLIPRSETKVKSRKEIVANVISNKKKQLSIEIINNETYNSKNHPSHLRLSRQDLHTDHQFQNIWTKYINDGIKSLPPFPELTHETVLHDLSNSDGEDKIFDFDKNLKPTRNLVVLSVKNSSQTASDPGNLRDRISSIGKMHAVFPEKLDLSPKEESIFLPQPYKKYALFEQVPPFAELHVPTQTSQRDVEGKSVSALIPNNDSVSERAGPQLYPSNIFEKESRVPFFRSYKH